MIWASKETKRAKRRMRLLLAANMEVMKVNIDGMPESEMKAKGERMGRD